MSYKFPLIELFDRLAIAEVKWIKTASNKEELDWYRSQVENFDLSKIQSQFQSLIEIHKTIWALESDLKSGLENKLGLEEIGRRAILIRDHNNKRVSVKNSIAELLGCNIREIKKDHLSEN
jgi:hypothetical protein